MGHIFKISFYFSLNMALFYLQVACNDLQTTEQLMDQSGISLEKLSVNFREQNQAYVASNNSIHLIVLVTELQPFVMKQKTSDINTTKWHGYCIDFFEELIKHLPYNVTFEIRQASDNKFGAKYKKVILEKSNSSNSTKYTRKVVEAWNGLVGDLISGKGHVALAPMSVMAERELVVDFTVPFYDLVGIQILLKKPDVPQDLFKFLTVLDNEVWLSITVAYFVTSFIIFLFDRLSPYSHKNLHRLSKLSKKRNNNFNPKPFALTSGLSSVMLNDHIDLSNSGKISKNGVNSADRRLSKPLTRIHEQSSSRLSADGLIAKIFKRISGRLDSIEPDDDDHSSRIRPQHSNAHRRASTDYLNTIKFGRSNSIWDGDDLNSSDTDDGKPDFGLRDSLWFCITSLTPQGGGEAPQNLSGRVVAGAWWLFCFIVIASYTANLAAFLTVSRLDIPIESLDDLAKQYRIKYAPIDGSAEQTYFERMANIEEIFYNIWKEMSMNDSLSDEERSRFAVWDYPISDKYTKIWAQIQQVNMPLTIEAGIDRVKNSTLDDGFALLTDSLSVRHAVMTDCSFKAVGDEFSRKPIALALAKGNDKIRDDLSFAILHLINQRYMEVLREKWWTRNPNRVVCDSNDESEGISIENIGGVFIIIFLGVIVSFVVWAIERFTYNTKVAVSKDIIKNL